MNNELKPQQKKVSNRSAMAVNHMKTIDPKDHISHTALLSPKNKEQDLGVKHHRFNVGPQTTLASEANTPNSKSKTRRASLSTSIPCSTTN